MAFQLLYGAKGGVFNITSNLHDEMNILWEVSLCGLKESFFLSLTGWKSAAADWDGGANAGGGQQAAGCLFPERSGPGGLQESADLQHSHPGSAQPAAEDEESSDLGQSGTQVGGSSETAEAKSPRSPPARDVFSSHQNSCSFYTCEVFFPSCC